MNKPKKTTTLEQLHLKPCSSWANSNSLFLHRHYDQELDKGNPRTGWAYVLTIQDLSSLLPPPATESASELVETWADHWQGLGSNQTSADAIIGAIDNTRNNTLGLLQSLK